MLIYDTICYFYIDHKIEIQNRERKSVLFSTKKNIFIWDKFQYSIEIGNKYFIYSNSHRLVEVTACNTISVTNLY